MKQKNHTTPQAFHLPWYQTLEFSITLIVSIVLIMVALVVAGLTFLEMRTSAIAEMEEKGFLLANTLNGGFETLLVDERIAGLQRIAENSTSIPDVNKVAIISRDGTVMISSKSEQVDTRTNSPLVQDFLQRADWEPVTEVSSNHRELVIIQPLRWTTVAVSTPGGDVFGAVEVVLDLSGAEHDARLSALRLLGISVGGYLVLAAVLLFTLRSLVVRPLRRLSSFANLFRQGEHSHRSTIRQRNEIGVLAHSFNHMADEVETSLTSLEQYAHDLEQQRAELTNALDELQTSMTERSRLNETIRELSLPVISLYDQIILLTLIGSIDTERAQQLQVSLLKGIERYHARKVIIDLTGVPVVDTQVAASLLAAAHAGRMLGAQVIIVGVGPEVAQSIVHLGVDLSNVVTLADLHSGVVYAFQSMGLEIQRVEKAKRAKRTPEK